MLDTPPSPDPHVVIRNIKTAAKIVGPIAGALWAHYKI
jgi:hypothetical protein